MLLYYLLLYECKDTIKKKEKKKKRERIEKTSGFYDSTRVLSVLGIGTVLGPPLMTFTENASTRVRTRTRIEKRPFSERGSAWLRLFRYVAKMAAVEYAKCTPLRTQRFGCFEYTDGSFQVHFFCRDHNRNTLRTSDGTWGADALERVSSNPASV